MTEGIEQHDALTHWRCPPLGGPVTFKHCRRVNDGLPCARMIECWMGKIDLPLFLKTSYTEAELDKAFNTPQKNRLETIFETLDKKSGK